MATPQKNSHCMESGLDGLEFSFFLERDIYLFFSFHSVRISRSGMQREPLLETRKNGIRSVRPVPWLTENSYAAIRITKIHL